MIEKIRAVYELYGFAPAETPAGEFTDTLGKLLSDRDRPFVRVRGIDWQQMRIDPSPRHEGPAASA